MRNGSLASRLDELSTAELAALYHHWPLWARDDQLPPDDATGDGRRWRVWMLLGGRGAGKTRAGAEWVRATALGLWPEGVEPARRIALVGETMADVRRVMIEGASGLLSVHPDSERPRFEASMMQLVWPNGTLAQGFSAEAPDSLRGPQFDAAWCDEIAKWKEPERTWDMLQFGLRLGRDPKVCVTTTPRPIALVKALVADPLTAVSRAATSANRANLAPGFVDEMERKYAGSTLGRQELLGEIVEETAGALWRQVWIAQNRVGAAPELRRIVVSLDPPVTATETSDACGIVVAGRGDDGRAYVLADRTLQGREPATWARAAIGAYHEYEADRIVAETNQGGDLVVSVLRQIDDTVPVTKVHATRGKWLRAEPVAALYAEGRVAHVGHFASLENEMLMFGTSGFAARTSPDRLDALVWALTDLMLSDRTVPTVRML
ncbi:MAG: terminase family protein [Hyphomicrobium sp.]|nr:terminase family protein [Hyphomicrobium sp.]